MLGLVTLFETGSAIAALLILIPATELVKAALDFLLPHFVPATLLPRMELEGGVPQAGRTLCVISVLLTGADSGAQAARLLEEYRLANRDCGENLVFGLLADLPEADSAETETDAASIESARKEVEALNAEYCGGFFLFTRRREFSARDGKYRGYERKRGAIEALCRMLGDSGEAALVCAAGDAGEIGSVRYLIVLDEDTRLDPGSARELIGAMLHPLNACEIDEKRRIVRRGHAVLQPRMAVDLDAARKSEFARAYAGQGGIDPYGGACSEVYMDLFGVSGFAGKGIIDVDAYQRCLVGRMPEGHVLSHDILEGAYLRGGFIGDVELTDGCPSTVTGYFRRMHRWTRGDWQNLPWLFSRGRELSQLDRSSHCRS